MASEHGMDHSSSTSLHQPMTSVMCEADSLLQIPCTLWELICKHLDLLFMHELCKILKKSMPIGPLCRNTLGQKEIELELVTNSEGTVERLTQRQIRALRVLGPYISHITFISRCCNLHPDTFAALVSILVKSPRLKIVRVKVWLLGWLCELSMPDATAALSPAEKWLEFLSACTDYDSQRQVDIVVVATKESVQHTPLHSMQFSTCRRMPVYEMNLLGKFKNLGQLPSKEKDFEESDCTSSTCTRLACIDLSHEEDCEALPPEVQEQFVTLLLSFRSLKTLVVPLVFINNLSIFLLPLLTPNLTELRLSGFSWQEGLDTKLFTVCPYFWRTLSFVLPNMRISCFFECHLVKISSKRVLEKILCPSAPVTSVDMTFRSSEYEEQKEDMLHSWVGKLDTKPQTMVLSLIANQRARPAFFSRDMDYCATRYSYPSREYRVAFNEHDSSYMITCILSS